MLRTTAILFTASLMLAGCNSWSTSNIKHSRPETVAAPIAPESVTVVQGDLAGKSYEKLTDLQVTVNKTTAFSANPTADQVIAKLKEEAASIGADAVINAEVSNVQVSAFSWGSRTGTGEAVKLADTKACSLEELALEDLQAIDQRIDQRVFKALSIEASVASRSSYGGTAPDQVKARVAEAQARLAAESSSED